MEILYLFDRWLKHDSDPMVGMTLKQLLDEWLGCSDVAGRDLWYSSLMHERLRGKIVRLAYSYHSDWSQVWFENEADALLDELMERLKSRPQNRKGKQRTFDSFADFHAYINQCISFGILDFGQPSDIVDLLEIMEQPPGDPTHEDEKSMEDEEHLRQLACNLLDEFAAYLNAKRRRPVDLIKYLSDLRAAHENVYIGKTPGPDLQMIHFLCQKGIHHTKITERLVAAGYNRNTISPNNARLRKEWREFLKVAGKVLWVEMKEAYRGAE